MEDKKIDILGSEWTIKRQSEAENSLLKTRAGYCDWTTRMIFVEYGVNEDGTMGDMDKYYRKVLRHEIAHAFLFESGLYENSAEVEYWATNEEMVEWIARQGLKLWKAWEDAGAVD